VNAIANIAIMTTRKKQLKDYLMIFILLSFYSFAKQGNMALNI
jgi:hypothetical protein